ncbi:MAG: dockerin type I domain-containing protein, partial [Pirellulaceae bacterium]
MRVAPQKDDNPLNGVSTYDLVLIKDYIDGNLPLSPYQMIAADANNSGTITTFDIVELRNLILGIYTELPNNTSWRFIPASYVFPQPNPFKFPVPGSVSIGDIRNYKNGGAFIGVKIGDINGSAIGGSADGRVSG